MAQTASVDTARPRQTKKPATRVDTFAALRRHPNFRLYWTGALVSNIGTWMQMLAQSWLVYQLTGSALLLGTVSFLQAIPSLFLALVGGVLADRIERRRLMIVTQTGSMLLAFALSALTLAGVVRIEHIMVIAFLSGLVNALNVPVRQGIISDLVPRSDLQNAIAVSSAQFQTSRLVGPALAGIVVAQVGPGWAFFLNGVSFLAVIASLLLLQLPPWKPPEKKVPMLQSAMEGVRFVSRHEVIGTLVLIAAVPALFAMSYQTLMPVFADTVMHVGAQGLGALLSATGLGALCGALIVASLTNFPHRGAVQLSSSIVFGLALVGFALSRQFVLSMALLVLASGCSMMFSSLNQTFLQSLAPDAMRGRILSVLTLTTFGMMPLGNLLAGSVAERWGAPLMLAIGGSVTACFAAGVLLLRPTVRRLE